MENQYGISIKNKYELFLENDDPLEILKLQEEQKLAAKKADKTKKSSPEKESKSGAKVKQAKTSPVTPATETKSEKSESSISGKSEDKQRRQKSETNDSRLLKDRGNKLTTKDDHAAVPDAIGKLEIGTFESQGSSGVPRERRGRGRGFGGGFRGSNERSPREGFEGGNDRRPPRSGGFGRPRMNNFRNSENQENASQLQEDSQQGETQGFKGFRTNQGSDDRQTQSGFSREKQENNLGEERKVGFRGGRRGFRTFSGENRGFGGNRRNYENRPPRRNQGFRNGPSQDEHIEQNGTDEQKPSGDQQIQEQQQTESFGHWGAENETAGEDGAGGPVSSGGFGGSRRGFRSGFGGRRGGRGRGRGGYDGRREFNRRGGGNEGGYGVKPIDKRDGTGSHNWGTVMDDLEAQNAPTEENANASWADQAEAAEIQENAVNVSAPNDSESAPVTEAEPEIQTMTLDEYKAAMEAKRLKVEFNIRKPNEGCVDEKWKKTFVLKKKEEEKDEEEDDEEDEETEEERHNKHKNVLPIEIKFADNRRGGLGPRGGGGFGGRRGSRGNFDRGGFNRRGAAPIGARGGAGGDKRHTRERAPNVADEKDFPSLAATAAP